MEVASTTAPKVPDLAAQTDLRDASKEAGKAVQNMLVACAKVSESSGGKDIDDALNVSNAYDAYTT